MLNIDAHPQILPKMNKQEKDQCIRNRYLDTISRNERLECGTFLCELSHEGNFDSGLFAHLLAAITNIVEGEISLGESTIYELYSIQRIILTLTSSHYNELDLFKITSTSESWLDDLALLDSILYTYIKTKLKGMCP